MNICVVSTFEGDVEEFMSMVAEFDEEINEAASAIEFGVVNTIKKGLAKSSQ